MYACTIDLRMSFFYSIVGGIYDDLQPLIQLDHLLLPLLVNICPSDELPKLFCFLPPYLSAAWLSAKVKDYLQGEKVIAAV